MSSPAPLFLASIERSRQHWTALTPCGRRSPYQGRPGAIAWKSSEGSHENSSRPTSDDEAVLLEAFRLMAMQKPAAISSEERRRLAGLALWTCQGWTRKRPVYATDDPILGQGLREHLPLWEPGGDLEQFRPLLSTLRIQEIQASNAEVTRHDDAPGRCGRH